VLWAALFCDRGEEKRKKRKEKELDGYEGRGEGSGGGAPRPSQNGANRVKADLGRLEMVSLSKLQGFWFKKIYKSCFACAEFSKNALKRTNLARSGPLA